MARFSGMIAVAVDIEQAAAIAVHTHGYGDQQVWRPGGGHLWRVSDSPAINQRGCDRYGAPRTTSGLRRGRGSGSRS